MDKTIELLLKNLWAPEFYLKVLVILAFAPIWWPLAKVMYAEIVPALQASEDAPPRRLPPGEDPFLNIPLAAHRARLARTAARGTRPSRAGRP